MSKMKPCPFCGAKAELFIEYGYGNYNDKYSVMCTKCECDMGEFDSLEEAYEKWNTRVVAECL